MTSSNVFIFLLFLFFITLVESEKREKIDKIIIHVPYKIHKHHHTHTKYKVITLPSPKHENTIIYLKENQQETKPEVQTQVSHLEESNFMPPHQQSAVPLLQHLQNYKPKAEETEQHQFGQATDQKFLESSNQNFVHNYDFQSMFAHSPHNVIPQVLLKPVLLPQEQSLTPKHIINPAFHQQHNFIPNFDYQPIFQPVSQPFTSEYMIKQKPSSEVMQDSVAHSTSHEYKTVVPRRPKNLSYKVKEEIQEGDRGQLHKQQHEITKIIVPSLKSNRKAKSYIHPGRIYNSRSVTKLIPSDPDYEYEHVGYLVIDGDSRKIVGKNFKEGIHLHR